MGRFWTDFFVISIIFLNNFFYNKCHIGGVFKIYMNFCYICYIIVVVEKYKYDLLSLLHLKVTIIYTYNFNLYQKIYIKYRL